MKQEIEIEFKNIVTKEEFDRLRSHFQLTEDQFISQENHYFDTPAFSLKDCGASLRIRSKKDKFVLTLKQPHQEGLLETHEALTNEQAKELLDGSAKIPSTIQQLITDLQVDSHALTYFGTLRTSRAEIPYKNGLLVLDHSFYLSAEDYELEYEVTDANEGAKYFEQLLTELDIKKKPMENKVRRFYKRKYTLMDGE
ncbi:CYTH domain-containing protein [Priestia megaterium]|uniref:CYTH domain-containing protein n=1 Tax=Priestia megaterium TaxID=1404 RepID=UPI0026E40EAF|nr:CYTH domain-containing protein [Priestia megaterium]MDO6850755.1 CYTH domain-containing protein [Priestia megaterium]